MSDDGTRYVIRRWSTGRYEYWRGTLEWIGDARKAERFELKEATDLVLIARSVSDDGSIHWLPHSKAY